MRTPIHRDATGQWYRENHLRHHRGHPANATPCGRGFSSQHPYHHLLVSGHLLYFRHGTEHRYSGCFDCNLRYGGGWFCGDYRQLHGEVGTWYVSLARSHRCPSRILHVGAFSHAQHLAHLLSIPLYHAWWYGRFRTVVPLGNVHHPEYLAHSFAAAYTLSAIYGNSSGHQQSTQSKCPEKAARLSADGLHLVAETLFLIPSHHPHHRIGIDHHRRLYLREPAAANDAYCREKPVCRGVLSS